MADIIQQLQSLLIDHLRLSLMSQLRQSGGSGLHISNRNIMSDGGEIETESESFSSIFRTNLKWIGLIFGLWMISFVYEYGMSGGSIGLNWNSRRMSLRSIWFYFVGFIRWRNAITIEGKHVVSVNPFTAVPVITNTFSKSFRSVIFHIIQNVDKMADVRELKEFAVSYMRMNPHRGESGQSTSSASNSDDKVNTNFTVAQRAPFLLDANRQIYCTIMECPEIRNDTSSNADVKNDTRIFKFSITLFSYTSSVKVIREYIQELKREYNQHLENIRKNKLFVYTLNNACISDDNDDTIGKWQETQHETMKSFDNLFFDGKSDILNKIDFFVNNKEWYKTNGVPYTLGIGLYGPPGTGKTSFIKALASRLNRHIVSISLARIKTKSQLQNVYYETQYADANEKNSVGFNKKIIVFEDIDCVGNIVLKRDNTDEASVDANNIDGFGEDNASMNRLEKKLKAHIEQTAKNTTKQMCANPSSQDNDELGLDDLLNLLDGIRENTGRILIMTSNHYNKLDPALVRPGRIDITLKLDNASRHIIGDMYAHYYGDRLTEEQLANVGDKIYSPAEVINKYITCREDRARFLQEVSCPNN